MGVAKAEVVVVAVVVAAAHNRLCRCQNCPCRRAAVLARPPTTQALWLVQLTRAPVRPSARCERDGMVFLLCARCGVPLGRVSTWCHADGWVKAAVV